jgi:hypothetical protein
MSLALPGLPYLNWLPRGVVEVRRSPRRVIALMKSPIAIERERGAPKVLKDDRRMLLLSKPIRSKAKHQQNQCRPHTPICGETLRPHISRSLSSRANRRETVGFYHGLSFRYIEADREERMGKDVKNYSGQALPGKCKSFLVFQRKVSERFGGKESPPCPQVQQIQRPAAAYSFSPRCFSFTSCIRVGWE